MIARQTWLARCNTGSAVALTANVMANDRLRYQASGFDACIAKPLDREEFEQTLNRLLPAARAEAGFADLPEFAAIQSAFREGLAGRVDQLGQALRGGDLAAVRLQAHTLKGSAATFGCPAIGEAAAQLERACRAADKAALDSAFRTLREALAAEAPAQTTGGPSHDKPAAPGAPDPAGR